MALLSAAAYAYFTCDRLTHTHTFSDVRFVLQQGGRVGRGEAVRTCDSADVADLLVFEVVSEQRRLQLLPLDDPVAVVHLHRQTRSRQVLAHFGRVEQACNNEWG